MRTHKGIPIANIYYMVAYAFEIVDNNALKKTDAEEFRTQQDLLATLLEKGISIQLKQGLHKEYLQRIESLPVLRGKIDMRASIGNLLAHRNELICEFDELTENNVFNQILKTTALLLFSSKQVKSSIRDNLKKEMLYFSSVDTIDPKTIHWSDLRFNRSNSGYRFLMSLCQLVIRGMLMTDEQGENVLAPDISEEQMHRLYEMFLLRYFQKHYPELNPAAPHIPWAVDDGHTTMLPSMKTDITLAKMDRVLIIDAKYYGDTLQRQVRYGSSTIHSANLYQIFTYVKNMAAIKADSTVAGMLLYARTEAAQQPDERFSMDGNSIYVRTLDLGTSFDDIEEQLAMIASLL